MKKYLMTGMAAIMFCGVFTSCSRDMDYGQTRQQQIQETYEEAFISRFGNPSPNQDWGFGPQTTAQARTRAVVAQPSVSLVGKTFNATVTESVNKVASVIDQDSYSGMKKFESYENSGWADNFYQINGTITDSEYSEDYLAQIRNIILNQIPEGDDNRYKASQTGYNLTTKAEGPVTLTPIYHNSSSGDMISYYYYPAADEETLTLDQIKALPKYTIGNIISPEECQGSDENHMKFNHNTYYLVYNGPSGPTHTFPAGIKINFIVTNNDLVNRTVDIYNGDAVATQAVLSLKGKFTINKGDSYKIGDDVTIENAGQIKFGNSSLGFPQFKKVKKGTAFEFNWGGTTKTNFEYYTEGNGVNGSLLGGSTVYYFKTKYNMNFAIGVYLAAGKTMKIVKINDLNATSGEEVLSYTNEDQNNSYSGCQYFWANKDALYAVYAEGSKLGLYGFLGLPNGNNGDVDRNVFTEGWGPFDFGFYNNFMSTELWMGKTPAYFNTGKEDGNIVEYSAFTAGAAANGGLTGGATTYYFKPTNTGSIKVAVELNKNKTMRILDLGDNNWNATNGTPVTGYENGVTNSGNSNLYGTYEFPVVANRVYAVYAEGSRLAFYGCEFFASESSSSSTSSYSTTTIPNHPEFYGDGRLNTEIHQCNLNSVQWLADCWLHKNVPDNTSHIAVFSINGKNYVGFEDWVDFDYNDVIFEVTGTEGGTTITEEVDEWDEIRVIAEDLSVGQNTDFDFNDIVYDVRRYKKDTQSKHKNGDVEIILRAAGGTLPLYLLAYDEDHEVHHLFGVDQYTMVNTNAKARGMKGKDDAAPVTITVTSEQLAALGISSPATAEIGVIARAIPVWVYKNEEQILLDAPDPAVGIASKFGVKITAEGYQWCDEREDIDSRYTIREDGTSLFTEWVQGFYPNNDWWKYAKRSITEYRAAKAAANNSTNP